MYGGDKIQIPRRIIPHFHPVKVAWDWFILVLILYTAICEPFAVCFYSKWKHVGQSQSIFDTLVDGLFIIDIILTFFTTVLDSKGDVVVSKRLIRKSYFKLSDKTWFPLDLIASIPYSAIGMALNNLEQDGAAVSSSKFLCNHSNSISSVLKRSFWCIQQ